MQDRCPQISPAQKGRNPSYLGDSFDEIFGGEKKEGKVAEGMRFLMVSDWREKIRRISAAGLNGGEPRNRNRGLGEKIDVSRWAWPVPVPIHVSVLCVKRRRGKSKEHACQLWNAVRVVHLYLRVNFTQQFREKIEIDSFLFRHGLPSNFRRYWFGTRRPSRFPRKRFQENVPGKRLELAGDKKRWRLSRGFGFRRNFFKLFLEKKLRNRFWLFTYDFYVLCWGARPECFFFFGESCSCFSAVYTIILPFSISFKTSNCYG